MTNFLSTKKFGPISTAHRQWRSDSHCRFVHGYGRMVEVTFQCHELDDKQWVQDFGNLKWMKEWIESQWDHRLVIASDDPEIKKLMEIGGDIIQLTIMDITRGHGPGIEGSCKFLFDFLDPKIREKSKNRVSIQSIQVWEHEKNSAIYLGPTDMGENQ